MRYLDTILAGLFLLATVVFSLVAIWVGDARYGWTAFVFFWCAVIFGVVSLRHTDF